MAPIRDDETGTEGTDPRANGREDGHRVYEYVTDQGIVLWSFTRIDVPVLPPTRLVLRDRRGEPVVPFLRKLRSLARFLGGRVP